MYHKSGIIHSFLLVCLLIPVKPGLWAQKRPIKYLDDAYQVYSVREEGLHFKLFDFTLSGNSIKTQYFGNQAETRFNTWNRRTRPQVLCYFAAGFAREWEPEKAPLGLCIDRGSVLNRNLDPDMDAFVRINHEGHLVALDIDREKVNGNYDLRRHQDKVSFLTRVKRRQLSAFQTQLMYSAIAGSKMGDPKYGKRSSRRFLAICRDSRQKTHHIVTELAQSAHLNTAAAKAVSALEKKGYQVLYLLNQDTGSRNIMTAFDEQGQAIYAAPVDISKATQLLVYYVDH